MRDGMGNLVRTSKMLCTLTIFTSKDEALDAAAKLRDFSVSSLATLVVDGREVGYVPIRDGFLVEVTADK